MHRQAAIVSLQRGRDRWSESVMRFGEVKLWGRETQVSTGEDDQDSRAGYLRALVFEN